MLNLISFKLGKTPNCSSFDKSNDFDMFSFINSTLFNFSYSDSKMACSSDFKFAKSNSSNKKVL